MQNVKTSSNPEKWLRSMPKRGKMRSQESNLVKFGAFDEKGNYKPLPIKRNGCQPLVNQYDSAESNYLQAFEPRYDTNETLARILVVNYNHKHRRKNSAAYLSQCQSDYLDSLENFNLCNNCQKPIKVKKALLTLTGDGERQAKHGGQVIKSREKNNRLFHSHFDYTSGELIGEVIYKYSRTQGLVQIYAEVNAHTEVYFDERQKMRYRNVPTRIYCNQICECYRSIERREKRIESRGKP